MHSDNQLEETEIPLIFKHKPKEINWKAR